MINRAKLLRYVKHAPRSAASALWQTSLYAILSTHSPSSSSSSAIVAPVRSLSPLCTQTACSVDFRCRAEILAESLQNGEFRAPNRSESTPEGGGRASVVEFGRKRPPAGIDGGICSLTEFASLSRAEQKMSDDSGRCVCVRVGENESGLLSLSFSGHRRRSRRGRQTLQFFGRARARRVSVCVCLSSSRSRQRVSLNKEKKKTRFLIAAVGLQVILQRKLQESAKV